MERKLIPQGTNRNRSYTITLPMAWVKHNGLDKSLKINLEVVNNRIIIGAKELRESKSHIEATDLDFILRKLIGEKYKFGIDEIEVRFKDSKTLDIIRSMVEKELVGFEIFEQTKNSCIIKDVAKESVEDFEKSLRRTFYLLLGLSEETLESLKRKDSDNLKRLIARDQDLNKLIYYCERQLNKRSQEYYGKVQFYFFLLERLENIGDMYKGLSSFFLESKEPFNKATLNVLEELNKKLKGFNDLFFSLKLEPRLVKSFYDGLGAVRVDLLNLYNKKNTNVKYLYYLGGLFHILNSIIRCLYSLKNI